MNTFKRTEEDCVAVIKEFYKVHGTWPRTYELPAGVPRMVQRNFGGMPAFRLKHGLGLADYTKGGHRSKITKEFNLRGNKEEKKIFDYLVKRFGRVNVHREYFFTDDSRCRADFCLFYHGHQQILIDTFFASNLISFKGCLQSKIKKYRHAYPNILEFPVIFVHLNPQISPKEVSDMLTRKTYPFAENQSLMSLGEFEQYLDSMV
jgi:hypothetical protein